MVCNQCVKEYARRGELVEVTHERSNSNECLFNRCKTCNRPRIHGHMENCPENIIPVIDNERDMEVQNSRNENINLNRSNREEEYEFEPYHPPPRPPLP
ncbi:hypothetical protein BX616_009228, partial [Lobosporangium transversale]